MRVFHFRDAQFGLKSLRERRLKIARIAELNDPFEFLGANLANRTVRAAVNATKTTLSERTGLLCFSGGWANPLLWSHYADHHRGLCLGFEVPKRLLQNISYVDERLAAEGPIDTTFVRGLLTTKFRHWSYEQEYRLFLSLDPATETNGLYFADFSADLKLTTVIVGARSTVSRADVRTASGSMCDIDVFKARPAFKTFNVVRNKNERLWV